MEQWSEAERFLVDRVRQRDGGAWAQLVARYQGRLRAFARARGSRDADADDLVQETFLRLLRSVDTFRGEASLESYLFLLLRRTMVDDHRGRLPADGAVTSLDASGMPLPPAPGLTASRYAASAEQLDRHRAALAVAV